jgi:hypothetical protein
MEQTTDNGGYTDQRRTCPGLVEDEFVCYLPLEVLSGLEKLKRKPGIRTTSTSGKE